MITAINWSRILIAAAVFSTSCSPPPGSTAAPSGTPDYGIAPSCAKDANDAIWKGLDLAWNGHGISEIQPVIAKGLAADPNCAVAQYLSASWNPDADSEAKQDAAVNAAAKAPEIDRVFLQTQNATRKGDTAEQLKQSRKLAELAPKSFFAQLSVSVAERQAGRPDESLAAAKKATELGPMAGAAWNQLAYAYSFQHKDAEAAAALKKYAEVAPHEANAHDTFADTLMAAGKLDDADAEYKKAIEVSGGKFVISYNGQAGVRFAKGDWDGGRQLLGKWKDAEPDAQVKVAADLAIAWTYVAEGKLKETLAAYDTVDRNAAASKHLSALAESPVARAEALYELGKLDDAAKALDAAGKVDESNTPASAQRNLRMRRAVLAVEVAAKNGRTADAAKALAAVDTEAMSDPSNVSLQDMARVAHGEAALAKKDAKAAVAALKDCQKQSAYCQWRLSVAEDAAGDPKGARATRDTIMNSAFRDVMYAFARAKASATK